MKVLTTNHSNGSVLIRAFWEGVLSVFDVNENATLQLKKISVQDLNKEVEDDIREVLLVQYERLNELKNIEEELI